MAKKQKTEDQNTPVASTELSEPGVEMQVVEEPVEEIDERTMRVRAFREKHGVGTMEAVRAIDAEDRGARLDAIIDDMAAAAVTHHPTAIKLLIKSVIALVEEIR